MKFGADNFSPKLALNSREIEMRIRNRKSICISKETRATGAVSAKSSRATSASFVAVAEERFGDIFSELYIAASGLAGTTSSTLPVPRKQEKRSEGNLAERRGWNAWNRLDEKPMGGEVSQAAELMSVNAKV